MVISILTATISTRLMLSACLLFGAVNCRISTANEIEDAAEEFLFQPGIEWKDYSVSVNAPRGTGDRSRDVWQIILRMISYISRRSSRSG